jgi:DNA-binding response OmpR family regulator
VEVDGKPLTLLKKEYDILLYFMQRPGHIVDKAMLAESVWGDHIDAADNFDFVYAQVKNLRKRLDAVGASLTIKAVYGFGYKLAEANK